MKKYYNAPAVELELFETADVITASPAGGKMSLIKGQTDASATAVTVDVATLTFQDPE